MKRTLRHTGKMKFNSGNYLSIAGPRGKSIAMIDWFSDPLKFAEALRIAADSIEEYHKERPTANIYVTND